MHNEIIASRRKYFNPVTGSSIRIEYRELEALDDDEFDFDDEISRLEAHLNDSCEDAWWVWNRCEFLGWTIEREYMPWDIYADSEGYEYCIYTNTDSKNEVIMRRL